MSDEKDILFEAITPLGFHVRVTKAYWELIVNIKHPIMAGAKMMSKMPWKIQTKSVAVSRTKTFICFTKQSTRKDGFARFPSKQVIKAF